MDKKLTKSQKISERYTLKHHLRQGGLGDVWLADDEVRRHAVVLKFLHPTFANKPTARELLTREFEQARRLIHPSIVRSLEMGEHEGILFLVSEFAGETTTDELKHTDYRDFLPILLPVVDALAYAHSTGLLHRDIKPTNIILNSDKQAFLSDFGLSLNLDSENDLSGGSLFYMSPQQLDGESLDPRDDIYAFGATLYELINGYPPFYPNVTAARVREETPAPLKSKVVLPPGLDELVFSMLSKRREDRPATFSEVRNKLIQFTDIPDQSTSPPDNVVLDQPIEAANFSKTDNEPLASKISVHTAATHQHKDKTVSMGMGLTALAIAIALVGLVIFLLPKFAPTIDTTSVSKTVEESPDETAELPQPAEKRAPYEEAKFQREREEAQNFTLALLRQQMALEDKKITLWAGEEFQKAQELADTGDELFREENFSEAMQSYHDAEEILKQLDSRADGVLAELLNKGQQAIEQGDGETAKEAFKVALTIETKNPTAVAGLKVADALPEITQLLAEADSKQRAGQLSAAKTDYEAVLKLQPDNSVALQERQRINTQLAGISFEKAMSDGFAALDAGDFQVARDKFQKAKNLRPNAQGPKDGLAQVDITLKGNDIDSFRAQAKQLESQEEWRNASEKYQQALDLDESLVFAKQGKFRALARARLHDQLQSYITRAERLSEAKVFSHAQDVLKQAGGLPRKGPVLMKQIETVTGLMEVARVPVRVRLESDSITNVVMFKVGRLGNFQSHELELIPGSYTVVGTRSGYRDVRQNFVVTPGREPPAVVVRCEDKI